VNAVSIVMPPPPSTRGPSSGARFVDDLFVDLSLQIEWLKQVLDATPEHAKTSEAVNNLRAHGAALVELESAIDRVKRHAHDRRFAHLFALDGALTAYLSRLFAWCEETSSTIERLAVRLRREEAVNTVFAYSHVNGSYAHFEELTAALLSQLRHKRPAADEQAWRAFESSVEELLWATEWFHVRLAKVPGT
jgi:hypothetical protein